MESLVESNGNLNIFGALEPNTCTIFKHKLQILLVDAPQFLSWGCRFWEYSVILFLNGGLFWRYETTAM